MRDVDMKVIVLTTIETLPREKGKSCQISVPILSGDPLSKNISATGAD